MVLSAQETTAVKPDATAEEKPKGESLFLKLPTAKEVIYDPASKRYIIKETVGGAEVSTPLFMSTTEYKNYRLNQDMKEYYKEKISALNGDKEGSEEAQKNLLPTYYVNSDLFRTIFGGNEIEVSTQGSIDVRMGALYQNIENPQLSEDNRKNTTFDFDQQVTASIGAKIGERLKVTANYDTKSTFDFQNLVKIEFLPTVPSVPTGFESEDADDILRKIELGNVSMDVSNNLISGSQSLFGIKTELQFGKTKITSVFSEQKSETKTVTAQGGSSVNEFELQTSQYDANKYFFLSHYFRNNYNDALKNFPIINSSVNIIKVEVWVTNRGSNTSDVRNIVPLTDLGENGFDFYDGTVSNISNSGITQNTPDEFPYNGVNTLDTIFADLEIRNIGTVKNALSKLMTDPTQGSDYTILENAKKLTLNEYEFDPQLGVLELKRALTDGDVLGVAFQYSVIGIPGVFQVGEFSTDGIAPNENLVVKMLRSEIKEPGKRIWDLMLKNVYSLGAYQMESEGFLFEVLYKDDKTGVAINTLQNAVSTYQPPGSATNIVVKERTLMNLMKLDSLDQNSNLKPRGDGYFDYVEGITVNSTSGSIHFPSLEPFGRDLASKLKDGADDNFLFKELYVNTQAVAQNEYQTRDKYLLKGYYKSDASNGISLGAFNVPRGSVTVTSNGILLTEGADYVVDYLGGKVQIINPAIEASGAPVQVSLENNTLFNQQTKRYVGIDVEHKFSDKFQMTGTYLNVNERPITQKTSYGADPINNTMLGLTLNYDTEVPWLTKMVNKLPFQDTDVPSQVSVRGDFAYMLPGTPKGIEQGGEATTYIDDFEGAQIPLNLMDVNSWKISSTPEGITGYDAEDSYENGENRANLAWYSIDRLFYGGSSLTPDNIDNKELSRPEVSRVDFDEIFPATDLDFTQSTTLSTFDLAYFPSERGSYNYDTIHATDTSLENPKDRWAGITRSLTTTDFQRANVEYIQFWVQDPWGNYSINAAEGAVDPIVKVGELFFNLGNISEDVLKDSRKSYENGLPGASETDNTEQTNLAKIPTNNTFLYAFSELDNDRVKQDVGLDGFSDSEEARFPDIGLTQGNEDRSTDNYRFFRGSQYDSDKASIITRYKDYNKTEGNSPTANLSNESYPTSATTIPDAEDINKDQTMNTIDAYWQYKISLNEADLEVGKNNIVDEKKVLRKTPDGNDIEVKWFQFRIPISTGQSIGDISDFNSIRFMRMFLTKFESPAVLRFGQLQLVRGDWRTYTKKVTDDANDDLEATDLANFTTGVVNIEENAARNPIPYQLPPGIQREQLQGSTKLQFQNEQALTIKVKDLPGGEGRSVYKNLITDLRMYKRLKMFVHAEGIDSDLEDDKLIAVMRLGSDLNENYYQIEVPLKGTQINKGSYTAEEIWPEANNIEVDLESLGLLKVQRFSDQSVSGTNTLYPLPVANEEPKYRIRVKGNPNLANIKTMMLGMKNISTQNQNAELWFNELRVAGFDNEGGWAGAVSANANFADLADVALTGSMSTIGFGGVEQRVNERSQENAKQYGVSSNVNVGQLMPKNWGIKIPLNYSVAEEFKDPKYDPKFQDVRLEDAKKVIDNSSSARDYTKRHSISLLNVRKERVGKLKKKPMPYDIENFSVSYSYNEQSHRDYNVQKHLVQDVKSSANYAYNIPSVSIEPFKKSKFLKSKYFKIIKEFNFNLLPSTIGVNSNITRSYNEQASRNLITGGALPTLTQRNFLFDWDYNIGYNLTKSLKFNFRAANKNIYDSFDFNDSPEAENIDLFSNFFEFGRASNYNQKFDANYQIPINKLPYLEFINADYSYTADFSWQAGAQSFIDEVGNSIQNANTHTLSSNLNMTKFYKEIRLKSLFTPRSKKTKKKKKKNAKKDDGKPKFATPTVPKRSFRKKKTSTGEKVLNVAYGLVTMVKTARASYTENNGTYLPGYKESVGFLGRSNTATGGLSPTFGFVFGDQRDIRQLALERDWLTTRNINVGSEDNQDYYSRMYTNTHYDKLDWSMSVKPIKDLDININANRINTRNESQQIDAVNDYRGNSIASGDFIRKFETTQLTETSNFSMTYSMFKTSFDGDGDATFKQFLDNRRTIQSRLAQESGFTQSNYGLNSQDVLLPAFTSAYSGNDASDESLKPFRNIPIPNWRLTYKGLMRLKWFKKTFSSFVVTHAYTSSYTIANMTNNAQYTSAAGTEPPTDVNGNYLSKVIVSALAINDGFSPLVKIDMSFKNSLSFRGEISKDRTLALSFNNNSISDIRGTEYVVGLGYIFKDLKLKGASGKRKAIKGDLNMKADISYRQSLTAIRTVDTEYTQLTAGQDLFSLKFSADYNLNKNLVATFYYDQTAAKYAISTSFPRQSISSGLSITYNIGN